MVGAPAGQEESASMIGIVASYDADRGFGLLTPNRGNTAEGWSRGLSDKRILSQGPNRPLRTQGLDCSCAKRHGKPCNPVRRCPLWTGLFPFRIFLLGEPKAIREAAFPANLQQRWSSDRTLRAITALCAVLAATRCKESGAVKTVALARPTKPIRNEGMLRGYRLR